MKEQEERGARMKAFRKAESRNRCREGTRYSPEKPRWEPLLAAFRAGAEELKGAQLQLQGDRELFVEGCRAVLTYDDDMAVLLLDGLRLTVLGAGLRVDDFTAASLTVRGSIRGLELEPVSRKEGKG